MLDDGATQVCPRASAFEMGASGSNPFIYPSGENWSSHARIVRGPRLRHCNGCFDSAWQQGSFMLVIAERLVWQQQRKPQKEPELFLRFVPAFTKPFGPVTAHDEAAIAKLPLEVTPFSEVRHAIIKTCTDTVNESLLTHLTPQNRRRHFVFPWMPLWCDAKDTLGYDAWERLGATKRAAPLYYALEHDNLFGRE